MWVVLDMDDLRTILPSEMLGKQFYGVQISVERIQKCSSGCVEAIPVESSIIRDCSVLLGVDSYGRVDETSISCLKLILYLLIQIVDALVVINQQDYLEKTLRQNSTFIQHHVLEQSRFAISGLNYHLWWAKRSHHPLPFLNSSIICVVTNHSNQRRSDYKFEIRLVQISLPVLNTWLNHLPGSGGVASCV